jgi:glycosyltransferase involved in cell wall biosynthesis
MSNQDSNPLVSIGMPLYNGEKYLKEAIDSVLNQTYTNIELVIVNDGSSDNSVAIVEGYNDPRVRLFHNDRNRGVSHTRNKVIEYAQGDYLAWMDCDDISLPEKIALQVKLMEKNKNIGVCGTSYLLFFGDKVYYEDLAKSHHEEIRANFVFKPATIFMPTAMIRMTILREDPIRFNENLAMAEDYDFFQRFCEKYEASNVSTTLFRYRDNPNSLTHSFENKKQERFQLKKSIYSRILEGVAIEATEADLLNHENCTNNVMFTGFQDYIKCTDHLRAIERGNARSKSYDQDVMKKVLKEQFFFISKKAGGLGLKTLWFYIKKSVQWNYGNGFSSLAKITLRSVLRYKEYNFKNKVFNKSLRQSE